MIGMKTRLMILCLLASAFTVPVKGKPHGKHQVLSTSSHIVKEKDIILDGANKGDVLPTFMTFEASSQEQDENMSYDDNADVGPYKEKGVFMVSSGGERSIPILVSHEALVDLLQEESEEEEVKEEEEEQDENKEPEETQTEAAELKGELEDAEQDSEKEENEEVLVKEEEEEQIESEETQSKTAEMQGVVEETEVDSDEDMEGVEEEAEDEQNIEPNETQSKVGKREGEEVEGDSEKEEGDEEVVYDKEVEAEKEDRVEKIEVMDDDEEAVEVKVEGAKEEKLVVEEGGVEEQAIVEEIESSTALETQADLDYIGESDITQPLNTELEEGKPLTKDAKILSMEEEEPMAEEKEEQASKKDEIPTATYDYEAQQDDAKDTKSQEEHYLDKHIDGNKDPEKGSKEDFRDKEIHIKDVDADKDHLETKNSMDLDGTHPPIEGEGESEAKNRSANHNKEKAKKQSKNHRVRKHPPQRDEALPQGNPNHQGQVGEKDYHRTTDNAVYKPKRRRAGKWATLVGMNPVQVRATVELYPSARPLMVASLYRLESSAADACENIRCKRGKSCTLTEEKKPMCVCQEPSACLRSSNDFEHVCGTDNVTYDTSCELFATKCNLEGTKKGHRLHLDYTGPCKYIAPCMNAEFVQFPLRMRDWLKNVLLQLYEHDSMSPDFLTPKQRIRVRKIHESERRLYAGQHPIELLAQDFEKNYNMYIYPVHWQFAQMDQHPSDRFLSHSELAPLRVPLVPMEHCTSRFFQECDADKDKMVSFREWAHCFGIKYEDMDVNLLF